MLDAIKYNLTNLVNFNGRDARQTFWYFVLFIVIMRVLAEMLITIPVLVDTFSSAFEAAKAGGDQSEFQQQINAQTIALMEQMLWLTIAIGLVSGLLLLASLVRRLHDSDHSGWWAALPAVLYTYALTRLPDEVRRASELLETMETGTPPDPMAMMQGQALNMAISWAPLAIVIVIGVLKSTPGPNRYGQAPVSF